ncbi:HAD family hydrolase [Sulfitobacter aestuariivivens]|uniref:phosphoglycolate phosphatase n=1 Tax=Sulfitobacter aestuariivivens TaxID=2766981 RepID=A0A927HD28_9RHOB|nr:HAD family hydrolase [Sulfitobacter aestuariivivens]MBD3662381.1 HAD family hydrolase [Sulfitobacter aestuariivivens]
MTPARDIKALIFDKDGTLFDFAATWEAWAQAFLLRLCDQDRAKAVRMGAQIGFDLEAAKFARDSVVIAGTPFAIAETLHPFFPEMSLADLMRVLNDEAEQAPQQEAVPLVPFLTDLRARHYRVGVATNDAEAPARAHLGQAGVTHLFDFIAGFDSGHGGKPEPGQLLAFAAKTGVAPAQTVMVGDSLHDLHAGRAAGMATVGVLTGMATQDELAPHADIVLPDIGHIPAWLGHS